MSRSSSSPGSRSSYHPRVKCAKASCNKETIKFQNSGNGKYSMFCSRHSCHAGYECKKQAEKDGRFCSEHAQCRHFGCGKRVMQEDTSFMYSKMKATTPSQEWWFCSDHRCKTKDCWGHRRSSNTKYCDEHADQNQCEVPDCSLDRTSKHYCDMHSCQQPNCTRQTFASGRNTEKCRRHQPCASSGCTQHVDLGANNSPEEYCKYHCRCNMRGCNAIVQTGSSFCAEHECYLRDCTRGRDLDRASDTRYCKKHRCSVRKCKHSFVGSDGYDVRLCSRHTCQRAGCLEATWPDVSDSPYCANHRCANTNCLSEAKIPGFPNGHCVQEACTLPFCGLPKESALENFCFDHNTPLNQSTYSTSPTIGFSRSSGRYNSPGNRQGRPVVPYAPIPDGMSVFFGGSPSSGSRHPYYSQVNKAYRAAFPRRGYQP